MATDADRFDATFQALMYDHPKHMFGYAYCVVFTVLSILNEATALAGLKDRDLFVELLVFSAVLAGVLLYSGRWREEKRRIAHLDGS